MQMVKQKMSLAEWGLIVLLSIFWGGSFFFVEIIIETIKPLTAVFLRVTIAAIALWMMTLIAKRCIPTSLLIWRDFFIMGLINNVIPFSLIVWAQVYINSGLASIYNATTPIFTLVVAGLLLDDEKITGTKIIALVLGLIGVIVLIDPSSIKLMGNTNLLAQLAVLVAAVSYAFASVFGRRFRKMQLPPMTVAAGQVTASSLWMLPLVLLIDPLPEAQDFTLPVIASILCLALISTAWAYMIYFKVLSSAGATNLTLVTFLVPISAILAGITLLDEHLTSSHIVGMGIITLALLCIDGRIIARLRK